MLRSLGLYTKLSQRASAALSRFDFEISRLDARASAVEMSDLAQISQEIDNNVVATLSDIDAHDDSGLTLLGA